MVPYKGVLPELLPRLNFLGEVAKVGDFTNLFKPFSDLTLLA
jgi:hypothetical protein